MRDVLNMGNDNSGTYISAKTSKKTKIVMMFFFGNCWSCFVSCYAWDCGWFFR